MQVIPCIDIRAEQMRAFAAGGRADQQTVYGDDPVAMARRWAEAGGTAVAYRRPRWGFRRADAQFWGDPDHRTRYPHSRAVGRGLRDLDAISRALDAGVHRVVLGTSALEQWDTLVAATSTFSRDRYVWVLIACNGQVATRGWQTVSAG